MKHGKGHLVAGVMSGTSLDGIDAALVALRGSGAMVQFTLRAHIHQPYPAGLRALLLRNSSPATSRLDDIARLNMLLGSFYADAVHRLLRSAQVAASSVHAIGCHGQTIRHLPRPLRMLGRPVRATLQIGDPSVLAALTGIRTVGNFRTADMAVGGEGAPLVPYFDWLAFRSSTIERVVLNVGGIANVTLLPRACMPDDVRAFDTGPGNMVIDALMQRFLGRPYDGGGRVAAAGTVIPELLAWMQSHAFINRRPPKSTGREEFGGEFLAGVVRRSRRRPPRDVVATATEFTAWSVAEGVRRWGRGIRPSELVVSGGGTENPALMRALERNFPHARVAPVDAYGLPSAAKEAVCFAVLAYETIAGRATNLPRVTGARKRVVLGVVAG
jgi:anhydro-N-acetylmuramic acid kinase